MEEMAGRLYDGRGDGVAGKEELLVEGDGDARRELGSFLPEQVGEERCVGNDGGRGREDLQRNLKHLRLLVLAIANATE